MKKSLLTIAILSGLSSVAFAASSVTLYGVIDAGVTVDKNHGKAATVSMTNGNLAGNRWGIKGEEELGNGNTVFFQLEQGFRLSNGTEHKAGKQFSRQSDIGIKGNWGLLAAGRFGGLSSDMGSFTILGGSPYTTSYSAKGDLYSAFVLTDRYDNSVVYQTPDFGGVKLHAMYSNGLSDDSNKWSGNAHYYGLGMTFDKGALSLNAIAEYLDNKATAGDVKGSQLYTFGASYDLSVVKFFGAYQFAYNSQDVVNGISAEDLSGAATRHGANQHGFSLGVSTPVAGGTLALQGNYAFGKVKDKAEGQNKYNSWSVGSAYTYNFSKRTTGYAYAGYGDTGKLLKSYEDSGLRGWTATIGMKHTF